MGGRSGAEDSNEEEVEEAEIVIPPIEESSAPLPIDAGPVAAVAGAPSAVVRLGGNSGFPSKPRRALRRRPGIPYHYRKKTRWKPGNFPNPRAVSYSRFRGMTTAGATSNGQEAEIKEFAGRRIRALLRMLKLVM